MTPDEQAAADKTAADAAAAKKVEFSDEQQQAIQKIFDKRFATVKSQHEVELQKERDEKARLAEELEAAKAGKGKDKDGNEAAAQQVKDLLNQEKNNTKSAKDALAKKEEEANTLKAENLNIRKNIAIRNAAGTRFVDMEAVLSMVETKIEMDPESKEFVVRENGVIRQNSSLQNMTLSEYFDEFAKKRPYLVSSDVVGGAGSKENSGAGGPHLGVVRTKADLKTWKDKSQYITKFGLPAYEELPIR